MKPPFNLGIVGCGGMGNAHVQAVLRDPSFKLVAVCDVNPDAFAGVPEDVPRYACAAELFEKHRLDLATLVLPNHLYEPTVELAARHGANVLCEKPLGHNLASCRRILETARKHNIRGWVSSQRKYLPHFLAAREKLAPLSIDFINVVFTYYWEQAFSGMGWRGDPQKSGGVAVIDSGWHVFDALYWLMGSPVTVFAQLSSSRTAPGIDEKAAIQLVYPSGALANLTISYTVPQNTFEFLFTDRDKAVVITYESTRYFEGGRLIDTIEPKEQVELVDRMYGELAKALGESETTPFITTFAQGEAIMAVIDACYRSAASGQVVKLGS
ncbi:MAG: Gfo/Idh/MocA family oxidoreductase [Methylacidiphilales bacterium]|nr:Gfo/Idh/MocA family oxidoreductase [Candidatus Methylacidiphilales bacterium]